MKELRVNGQFNIVGMIIDRERRSWRYYSSENKETYFDDFDERYVVDFVDGSEDILMEYIRKLII